MAIAAEARTAGDVCHAAQAKGARGSFGTMVAAVAWDEERVQRLTSTVLVLMIALVPAVLAAERSHLSYAIETDFVGNYIVEADRLLAGQALEVGFHPPLYPGLIALARTLVGDWVTAGLAVSVLAALVGGVATLWFVRGLLGPVAAVGALAALLGSPVFLQYAAAAAADVVFFALHMVCCALALAGIRSGSTTVWRLLGLALGAALLTRTNAVTLLLLLAAPFLGAAPRRRQFDDAVRILAAAAIPLIAWFGYAMASGSPPLPTSNHVNLAMTYFAAGPDRFSADAYATLSGRFDGVLDVLLHDPARLVATYAADLFRLLRTGIPELLVFPLFLLFLPGVLWLIVRHGQERPVLLFGVVFAAQLLLVNLKAFEARYYLFVLPVLGAGLGIGIEAVLRAGNSARAGRGIAVATVAAGLLLGFGLSVHDARSRLLHDEPELAAAVAAARRVVEPGDTLVARKPHLAFYTGARLAVLADTSDPDRLHEQLCAWSSEGGVHLFYGRIERQRRAGLRDHLLGPALPHWLEVEAASAQPGGWVLFRFSGCAEPGTPGPSLGPWRE